ncbi:MAG: hypothetical protein Q4G69_08070 [Planctomycetia bacterium]|nr:hypothetical protein [Planctomycetia bacterium]
MKKRILLSLYFGFSLFLFANGQEGGQKILDLPEIAKSAGSDQGSRPFAESPWKNWSFYSDEKIKGDLSWEPAQGPNGEDCIRIVFSGNGFWSLTGPAQKFDHKIQCINSIAWIKVKEGKGIMNRLDTYKDKKRTRGMYSGAFSLIEDGIEWTSLQSSCNLADADLYFAFISGFGKADLLLAPISIYSDSVPDYSKLPAPVGFLKKRVEEKLDRAPIALAGEDGVYIGWRLLKTDPDSVGFNVYRANGSSDSFRKMNPKPITKTTDLVDRSARNGESYTWKIQPIIDGKESGEPSTISLAIPKSNDEKKAFLSIPMPDHDGDQIDRICMVDLNGDGKLDFLVKKGTSLVDPYINYWKKSERTVVLEAYDSTGKFLWKRDLGWSIEQGIWYSPIFAFDFAGEGCVDVAAKTVKGDPRDKNGRVHSREEFVSIFDGRTGKTLAEAPWPSKDGFMYNQGSRNFLGVAYLDGNTPFLIAHRGTYGKMNQIVYLFHGDKLEKVRSWNNMYERKNRETWGQGAHRLHAADVDGDGKEELCMGSFVFDENGSVLWSLGLGHPDQMFVGDLNPKYPGMEIYFGVETANEKNGMCMVHAATGEYIWGYKEKTYHIHANGLCSDIDARYPGSECFSGESKTPGVPEIKFLRTADGDLLAKGLTEKEVGVPGLGATSVWWDQSHQRLLLRGNTKNGVLMKLTFPEQKYFSNVFSGKVLATGDFFGDWREEIITGTKDEIRIYSTRIPAADRRTTLLQDRNYRATTIENFNGYGSLPIPSFDLASTPAR